jgi:hypothetical protein
MISVESAHDLHVHSAPCLYPRIADDLTIVEAAQAAGLRGLMLKSHHEPTVGRAFILNQLLRRTSSDSLTVYGSLTLNHAVGGINPAAVEAALKTGARMVWMPTVDSQAHQDVFGHTGSWDVQGRERAAAPPAPLTILAGAQPDEKTQAIVKLCQEYNVPLCTGHLGQVEIFALAQFARAERFERLVVTHPLFKVPHLDHAALTELASLGVYFEFTYCTLSPMWCHATIDATVTAIRTVGIERAYLSSDGGQPHNPMPHEGLRLLAQMCVEKGIAATDVQRMIRDTPAWLVNGLDR